MKKSFMYIFFCIILICFLGSICVKNSNIRKYFVLKAIPIVKIVNEERNIGSISYMNIIRYKLMSENIFIELPEDNVELVDENVENEVLIQENEIENDRENNVKSVTLDWQNELRNETKYKIDIEKLKNEKLKFDLKNEDTEVIIYHTHTTETYSKSSDFNYNDSGEFRTLDKNANVIRIGNYLKDLLEDNNIKVYHDTEYYDYPSYNLSYSKAGKAILNLTKKYKEANIVLDIHRDALGTGDQIYRPVIEIDGEDVAQILLVVGTNQGGLNHPNWKENLKFALKLQQAANEKYPGLCRYVSLRKERFNQQVSKGAIIVEMGATGNTIDEVERATKLFSEILLDVME